MRLSGGAPRRHAVRIAAAIAVAAATGAGAEPMLLRLDPATTQVRFTLEATLHTVEGALRLASGEIALDSAGGPASGRVVLDARSAETGLEARDATMHEQVLESERYPEIVFLPERVKIDAEGPDHGEVRLAGTVEIHGSRRAFEIPARVVRDGKNVWVRAAFDVPYVEWGLPDPSTFVLRVAKEVHVEIEALARLTPAAAPAP